MSYDIAIEVDASGAIVSIDKVARSLDGVEKEAKRAGDAATKATRETSLGAETAKRSTESLAKAFGGLNAELQREAAMLDRLRGPSLRYNEDLRVLDRLLDQNKISVAEYTAELTKMNRALEGAATASNKVNLPNPKKMLGGAAKIAGTLSSGAGGMLSNVGAGLATGGVMGLAIAAAPAIQYLGEKALEAADVGLTKLSNVLNSSTIAARKAAEAFIAHARRMEMVFEATTRAEAAVKAYNDAVAAGVRLGDIDGDSMIRKSGVNVLLSQNAYTGAFLNMKLEIKEAEKHAFNLADALKALKDQDAAGKLAEDAARTHKSLSGINDILKAQQDNWQSLTDKVAEYEDALDKIKANRALTGVTDITRDQVDVVRGLLREKVKLANTYGRYGKLVEEVTIKEMDHRDALADVRGAFKAGEITMTQYTAKLRELGVQESEATKLLKAMTDPLRQANTQMDALNSLFLAGKINAAQYNAKLVELRRTLEGIASVADVPGYVGAKQWGGRKGVTTSIGYEAGGALDAIVPAKSLADMGLQGSSAMNLKGLNIEQHKGIELTKVWAAEMEAWHRTVEGGLSKGLASLKSEITDVGAMSEKLLVNAFHGAEDALVSFVKTGKLEFKSLIDSMLADLTRLLIRQGITALLGLATGGGAGLAAGAIFGGNKAFGGDYRVGGSGGPDSQRVMFNLTPGEHVRFTPPGSNPNASERQATPEAKQPITVVLNAEQNELETERLVLKIISRNLPHIRGAVTGR